MRHFHRALFAVALLSGAATIAHAQVVWGGGGVGASAPHTRVDPVVTTRSPHVRIAQPLQMQVYINGILQSNRLSVDSGSGFAASQQSSSLPQVPSHASGGAWNGSQPVWGGSPAPTGTATRTTIGASRAASASSHAPIAPLPRPSKIVWGTPPTLKGSPVP
jgi:hypothetical protein